MLKQIKLHLMSNEGSEYIEKLVLIVIAFVVGGLLLTILYNAFSDAGFQQGLTNTIQEIFDW